VIFTPSGRVFVVDPGRPWAPNSTGSSTSEFDLFQFQPPFHLTLTPPRIARRPSGWIVGDFGERASHTGIGEGADVELPPPAHARGVRAD